MQFKKLSRLRIRVLTPLEITGIQSDVSGLTLEPSMVRAGARGFTGSYGYVSEFDSGRVFGYLSIF